MPSSLTRRSFLATASAGFAAGALARAARAAQDETPDQMLDELIKENQENGLGSGFDNASRNVKLPKKSLPTLSPSTAETTQTSIAQYETIVAKGGWSDVPVYDFDGLAPAQTVFGPAIIESAMTTVPPGRKHRIASASVRS